MAEHDPTDPDAPVVNLPDGVVSGESTPPDEHTLRVRANRQRSQQAPTHLSVHDDSVPPPPAEAPSSRSSSEMARSSRKHRRRERDRRAEKRAIQVLLVMFVGLGGAAFVASSMLVDDTIDPVPPPPKDGDRVAEIPPENRVRNGVISTVVDQTKSVPAVSIMKREGLTIVAEGIPQVDALADDVGVQALAALETCRFSYAVWEFSPNKRFRFLSTCGALDGQVMFGAYEIFGDVVRMSPLVTDTDAVVSEFSVSKPSMMTSKVSRRRGGLEVLTISQRVTSMRPGLDGEAWRDAFSAKNTINLPTKAPEPRRRTPAPPSAPPPPTQKGKDPLLDLLKKNG